MFFFCCKQKYFSLSESFQIVALCTGDPQMVGRHTRNALQLQCRISTNMFIFILPTLTSKYHFVKRL